MPNLTAQNSAIATPVADGASITLQSAVSANDAASCGTYELRFIISDVNNNVVHDEWFYNAAISQTPQTFARQWVNNLPAGHYKFGVWPWLPDYSAIATTTQTYIGFDVGPAVASLVKCSGDDQGCVINASPVQPMVVTAKDANGNPVSGVTVSWTVDTGSVSAGSSVTDANGNATIGFTGPASPCKSTITAIVGSLSVEFTQTSHIALYGTHWKMPLLKPAGSGDPLAGVGFVPDDGESYTLITSASDEFDGTALDTSKWKTRYIYNNGTLNYLNDELERYIDNHIVSNGTLKLTAHARTDLPVLHAPSPSGDPYYQYDSSMIRSITTFKYGYFEMRAKVPPGMGVWPAFWINPQVGWPPEIDIIEYVRNNTTELPSMIHHNVHPTQRYLYQELNTNTQYAYWRAPANLDQNYFTDDFHVYSCIWDEIAATFFIDGEPVASVRCPWLHDDGSDGGLAHLLVNLAMGGSWPTNYWTSPVALDDQVFEIDYVRVYQKAGQSILGSATV